MEHNYNTLGVNLKSIRKASKISQDNLAEKIGFITGSTPKRQTISRWEHGYSAPKTIELDALCDIFDCDSGFFLGEHEETKRKYTDICSATGLSERAVNNLCGLSQEHISILDMILSDHEVFNMLLTALSSHIDFCKHYQNKNKIKDIESAIKKTASLTANLSVIGEILRMYL